MGVLLVCVLPTLATAIYLTLLTQPTYQTEAQLIVRESQGSTGPILPGFASALLGAGSKTSLEDSLILQHYLHSAGFIELADEQFDLRRHFAEAPLDPLRRLSGTARAETFHEYFRKMVSIHVVHESSIMTIRVQTFSPVVAQALASFIIDQSEQMINHLNDRMTSSQTTLAQRELEKGTARLMAAREDLFRFQVANRMVDPVGETSAFFGNVATLDARLVEKRTQLRLEAHYLQEDSFDLRRLRQEIRALEEQRAEETRLLVTEGDTSMANTLQAFEKLQMNKEFALAAYTAAFTLAEKATLEASRQEKFLLVISPPHLPEKPVFPRPVAGTLTFFVLSWIGYGILKLVLATIRDHTM
jgi:capsular polysaccharide transport system permease protein